MSLLWKWSKWPEQMNKEEDDTVKLRKQMQFALNKFVDAGVEDPLIVGLTVEGKRSRYTFSKN